MTEMESAIGIIGGADGPTVIFISGDATALITGAVVVLCVAVAAIAFGVKCWRHRKKHQA